jgi:transposase
VASAVAREAGIHVSQLFRWRQELCQRGEAPATFTAVTVSPEAVSAAPLPAPSGVIEIEFATGARLRITGAVDVATLSAAVAALAQGERRR